MVIGKGDRLVWGLAASFLQGGADSGEHRLQRTRRRQWTPDLHKRFVAAVHELGGVDLAKPKAIHTRMAVEDPTLTLTNIESHVRTYKSQLVKEAQEARDRMHESDNELEEVQYLDFSYATYFVAPLPYSCLSPCQIRVYLLFQFSCVAPVKD